MPCKRVLLLACAVSLPAAAQTAVFVNGLLDTGVYRGFDGVDQVGTIQRSNIAFSGVDDLGDGARIVFRLSTRVELDTGQSEGAGVKPFWHDESTVGLAGRWGTLRVGRAMTAMWANDYKFDPWANYNRIASPAWYLWHCLTPSDPYGNKGTAEYGRLNKGIFYDSPRVEGFTVRLSGTPAREPEPGASGRAYSAVLEYGPGAGPVSAMLAFERNSIGDKDSFAAGKYSAGGAAVMAAYDDSRTFDDVGSARAVTLDASYRIGRVTLKAGSGRQRLNTPTVRADTIRFASLGADYALSRRSTLYASLGRKRDAQQDARTSFGVGMSHAF